MFFIHIFGINVKSLTISEPIENGDSGKSLCQNMEGGAENQLFVYEDKSSAESK